MDVTASDALSVDDDDVLFVDCNGNQRLWWTLLLRTEAKPDGAEKPTTDIQRWQRRMVIPFTRIPKNRNVILSTDLICS